MVLGEVITPDQFKEYVGSDELIRADQVPDEEDWKEPHRENSLSASQPFGDLVVESPVTIKLQE